MAEANVDVKLAGSQQITFEHACERVAYWTQVLKLTEIDHFKEWNSFMEIKATGCIEEWEYIKHVMCPNHHMEVALTNGTHRLFKCPTCGHAKFERNEWSGSK